MRLYRNRILRTDRDRLISKAQRVALFLNQAPRAARGRVAELVEMCEILAQLLPQIRPTKYVVSKTNQRLYDLAQNGEAKHLLEQINQRLAKWKFRMTVDRYVVRAPGKAPSVSVTTASDGKFSGREQMLEGDISAMVIELLEADFSRVRKCRYPECSRWFVAKKDDASYCPAPHRCQHKHYQETHRKQWNAYMRRYRKNSV